MIGRPLIRLDAVSSTQDVVFRLAALGASEGTTVLAGHQTGGRGRAGRVWTEAPGDALLFSFLLRPTFPPGQLAPFSLLLGDAIATTLADLFHMEPAVKWPNDVLLDGRKVSGVLMQARRLAPAGGQVAVCGIGLNVNSAREDLPPGGTSLRAERGERIDPEPVLRHLLREIDRRYVQLQEGRTADAIARINERLWLRGGEVTLDDAGRLVTGWVRGVDPDGALVLDTGDGTRRIVSGELTRGPRPALP